MSARHVLALVLLAASGAARAQDVNVVTAVSVSDEGDAVVLTVEGSKAPNFTTFSMADPPRFIIDLSEARFENVLEDIPVNDGTILLIKNLSYGSDTSSIAISTRPRACSCPGSTRPVTWMSIRRPVRL